MFNFAFMLQFAPCKINIGLNILNKRSDNYHNLETIFYPLNWFDALEITDSDKFIFNSFGIEIKIPVEKNLITQAYNLLKNDCLRYSQSLFLLFRWSKICHQVAALLFV